MQTQAVELGQLACPDAGSHPGIVLVHDVWGLGDHARDLTCRLAAEGFAVLGIDLYRRIETVKIENPGDWMRNLSDPEILSDIETAAEFLAAHPATGGAKVGVVGFCMGGMYALMAGCGPPGISAAVGFYGLLSHEHGILYDEQGLDSNKKPEQPLAATLRLRCPLLMLYGDQDEFVPMEDIETLRRCLAGVDPPTEVVVYAGAGHAFANDTRPDAYREQDARDAWARMTGFLKEQLS